MTTAYKLCLIGVFFLVLNSCANPINRVTYQRYYQAGFVAEQEGQYELAKMNYYRALVNVRMGNLEPQRHAAAAYSYGRMLGILCDHKNAELMLTEALKYDKETSGPTHMALFELALLKYDREEYAEAVSYFGQAIPIVDKEEFIGTDPGQFVAYFTLYARALQEIGRAEEGKSFSIRAEELAKKYPDAKPRAGLTPYMKNCAKPDSSGDAVAPTSKRSDSQPKEQ